MSNRSNDWPFVALVLGILAFVAYLTTHGHPGALAGLVFILFLFFL